jgi:hypothetical protein
MCTVCNLTLPRKLKEPKCMRKVLCLATQKSFRQNIRCLVFSQAINELDVAIVNDIAITYS